LERAKAAILAHPLATRDEICSPEMADVSHAVEDKARGMLQQVKMTPSRGKEPDDDVLYNNYVEAGKKAANMQWTLGDLAIKVTALKSYGEAKLATYAEAIGVEYKTLQNCRAVAKAWLEIPLRRGFSVCAVLAIHPDRVALVEADPTMTVAEAREIMREYKAPNVVNLRSI
jgi:hypothetical protein